MGSTPIPGSTGPSLEKKIHEDIESLFDSGLLHTYQAADALGGETEQESPFSFFFFL
jgi:hypothetical protein